MKISERLKKKAKKIVELEKRIQNNKDDTLSNKELEEIINSLSLEDLFEIDEYIMSKRKELFKE